MCKDGEKYWVLKKQGFLRQARGRTDLSHRRGKAGRENVLVRWERSVHTQQERKSLIEAAEQPHYQGDVAATSVLRAPVVVCDVSGSVSPHISGGFVLV